MGRDLEGGWIHVVRALAHVDVLVWMQVLVFAPAMPHELERAIGDHLVRVHVGRCAGPSLDHVHDELVVQLASAHLVAGLYDRVTPIAVE